MLEEHVDNDFEAIFSVLIRTQKVWSNCLMKYLKLDLHLCSPASSCISLQHNLQVSQLVAALGVLTVHNTHILFNFENIYFTLIG